MIDYMALKMMFFSDLYFCILQFYERANWGKTKQEVLVWDRLKARWIRTNIVKLHSCVDFKNNERLHFEVSIDGQPRFIQDHSRLLREVPQPLKVTIKTISPSKSLNFEILNFCLYF